MKMEPFLLQLPLWRVVESVCPRDELEDVKNAIGSSLVDLAADLFQEASTLLEIYQATQEDFDKELLRAELTSASLPEPPVVRDRLLQEISFLVEHLQQNGGISTSRSLPGDSSSRKSSVLDYVVRSSGSRGSTASSEQRPASSVCGRDGGTTPLRATPTSESGSCGSSLSDKIDKISGCINSMDIDTIVQHIRDSLNEECLMRKGDIKLLQTCLEDEVKYERQEIESITSKPSIHELKKLRTSLESDFHTSLSKDFQASQYTLDTHSPPSHNHRHHSPHSQQQQQKQQQQQQQHQHKQQRKQHKSEEFGPVPKSSQIEKRPSTAARFREMVHKTRPSSDS